MMKNDDACGGKWEEVYTYTAESSSLLLKQPHVLQLSHHVCLLIVPYFHFKPAIRFAQVA
jgi:hypothetical protein